MAFESQENQLELFDLRNSSAPRVHRETLGRILVHVRHDQLVLVSMAVVLGITVVFACGVERGKVLVRSERSMLVRQPPVPSLKERVLAPAEPVQAAPRIPSGTAELPAAESPSAPAVKKAVIKPSQAPGQKLKTPVKLAGASTASVGKSRYAIQVVTCTQAKAAKQEMDRLHAKGEKAFLVMREGRTVVYVGPFPSKSNAVEKVTMLKSRYQDCFIKTL